MPTWGLTEQQRTRRPWGLHPELLVPRKVTTDPVHGDIHTTALEQAIVDTAPFQRLRRVRQLGFTHEVYPGATHTRFSHSLGALRVVQDLLDGVLTQREGRHAVPDLLTQWVEANEQQAAEDVAQAVVLARLGALLHDLCHVPFGHSIEDDLRVLVSHDENGPRFQTLWGELAAQLPDRVRRHVIARLREHVDPEAEMARVCDSLATLLDPDGELHRELRPLIISKDDHAKRLAEEGEQRYPFAADLVGNTICADLLDYLLRDHLYTGLPASLGHRFTSAFFLVPTGRGPYSRRVALNIMQDGYERTDVISELLKALRYRYELSERALYHHAKLSADVMIGKGLDLWARAIWLEEAASVIPHLGNAEELIDALDDSGLRHAVKGALTTAQKAGDDQPADRENGRPPAPEVEAPGQPDGESGASADDGDNAAAVAFADLVPEPDAQPDSRIVQRQQQRLEAEVLAHGDDGLLERIASLTADASVNDHPAKPVIDALLTGARRLGQALLDRELFAIGGRVGIDDAPAAKLYERFGDIEQRTDAQGQAQRFAEIGREPQVLIWLPDPAMRLKLARVLVDNGEHINEFQAFEEARGGRGADIYAAHRRLWSLWVFCDRRLTPESQDAVMVYLATLFGVAWERMRECYGPRPGDWVVRHGLSRLLQTDPDADEVNELLPHVEQLAARGPDFVTVSDVEISLREIPEVNAALQLR